MDNQGGFFHYFSVFRSFRCPALRIKTPQESIQGAVVEWHIPRFPSEAALKRPEFLSLPYNPLGPGPGATSYHARVCFPVSKGAC